MRCPRDGSRCSRHGTVRRCPGCPLYQQAKEARQAQWQQAQQQQSPPQPPQPQQQMPQQQQQMPQPQQQMPQQPPPQQQQHQQRQAPQPQQRAVDSSAAVVYRYDGSLAGFFCCVYESFYLKEMPSAIKPERDAQPTLLYTKTITTDQAIATRVRDSIPSKISEDALDLIENVFFSCLKQKELYMLRFLLLAYREGTKTLEMLGHPDVVPLLDAEKHLFKEAHLLKGFVRFSDYGGVLASCITPKNFILPFIANHFCSRFPEEEFIIFDKNHKAALIHQGRRREIISLDELPFPEADEAEERYRALWKNFYHTIAIEARYNPRCRMTHLPKRYWENMTEMRELL